MHNTDSSRAYDKEDATYGAIFIKQFMQNPPSCEEITGNGIDLVMLDDEHKDEWIGFFYYPEDENIWILAQEKQYRASFVNEENELEAVPLDEAAKVFLAENEARSDDEIQLMLSESTFESIAEANNPTIELTENVSHEYTARSSTGSSSESDSDSSKSFKTGTQSPPQALFSDKYEDLGHPRVDDLK